ncbi:glycoside hydrolase family 3 protein [Brenneria tiliae]|uniref:Glycoside hydrolase family 3 C-terminal domain-containing protein n=1 Tax=Brenneria tiliae TaxID=2914984 RepID=A0ABT0N1D1_9GAMM|nr:glycoside hydrolase family 3 C-terminal domain-containing protein [Brenneria tiliae]MCL2895652.1 glycoside hydrolase family 3 C-terminal domain-containing protein [Brenneria tiliae]
MSVESTVVSDRGTQTFELLVQKVQDGTPARKAAEWLYQQLSDEERLAVLHGDVRFWPGRGRIMRHGYNHAPFVMGSIPRLGVPGIRFIDGPRGVVVGSATAFPVSMARGATWDVALEQAVGQAIGLELRATGGNLFGGVCINLPRHPAWGRAQESYSDQSIILGEMGAALVRGVKDNAMTCVKHYALNSMENARFDVDVTCDEATMHEDYLAHFKRAIDAGADSVMCAYNAVNGHWASESVELLTDILRDTWGFDGFVLSDFIWAIRNTPRSLEAGLDLEAPFKQLRGQELPEAIGSGQTSWETVRTSALRILATQLKHYATRTKTEPSADVIAGPTHRELARYVARRAMVLLRNVARSGIPTLPLKPSSVSKIAVIGRLANIPNLGDRGSSNVTPPETITVLTGIRNAYPNAEIRYEDGASLSQAVATASEADAVILVVGYTAAEEGEWVNGRVYGRDDLMKLYPVPETEEDREVLSTMLARLAAAKGTPEIGGDRKSLRLLPADEELIHAVSAANPNTIVVVQSAGAVVISDWDEAPQAIIMMWYAGMEGGRALADLIGGNADFSGRLPYAIPRSERDLPEFDIDAKEATYDRWYGQRKFAHDGNTAAYPLGFGLSYSPSHIDSVGEFRRTDSGGSIDVTVSNKGEGRTWSNIQLYATRLDGERAGERELVGFSVVELDAGAFATTTVSLSFSPLSRWDRQQKSFYVPSGRICLEASRFWGDPHSTSVVVSL